MCVHYRMKHCKPTDGSRQINPLVSKPLCDRPRAFAPPMSERDVRTDRCSQVWERHIENINKQDGDAFDAHSDGSAANDSKLRQRYRTMNMLRYLAVEPSGLAYAAIIEAAHDQIIRGVTGFGRAFIQGSLGDHSPVESLALGRYKKSIEAFSYSASSTERARKTWFKRRKAGGCAPVSVVNVPMLLALALTRGGLETYVDDDDEDRSDVSSLRTADFEYSHASSDGDGQHSSASEDSEPSNNDASEVASEHAA
jgi:hypothetical protein